MHVLATAGHVDHGRSTLVRALTGMEPDRWAQERERGMTIDLGFAWTTLPSGSVVQFVDVPGHKRFIGNMLAGLGPAPAVLLVVAADEGWRAQTAEHLAAVDAMRVQHGLVVVTRSDLADPVHATREALDRIAGTSIGGPDAEVVAVSGATGQNLDLLTEALQRLVDRLPAADAAAPVRLWLDRAFTMRGSGVVVTGTLAAGTLRVGDELEVRGRRVRVRGLQNRGVPCEAVGPVSRVAVNLRGAGLSDMRRGDALVTPQAWWQAERLDVRLNRGLGAQPNEMVLHVGTAAVPVRLRRLGDDTARLTLARALPLRAGDRALLRDPGSHLAVGAVVLDADPPPLARRGAGAARASALRGLSGLPELATEVARRGAVRARTLAALGVPLDMTPSVLLVDDWYVAEGTWRGWQQGLRQAVDKHVARAPLEAGLSHVAAGRALGVPDVRLVVPLVEAAGLETVSGRIRRPGAAPSLGPAESSLRRVELQLQDKPFGPPDIPELRSMGLLPQHLAAAATAGRVLRLPDDVLLLPDGPARAMAVLARLPQPFTASQARAALGTTRRVVIPLLEHLDERRWTRRVDSHLREVVR